mgnify:FL=1
MHPGYREASRTVAEAVVAYLDGKRSAEETVALLRQRLGKEDGE